MPVRRIYRVATPYNASELLEMDHAQVADVIYFVHQNHEVTKLIRSGNTDWSFETVTFGPTIAAPTGVSVAATVGNSVTSGDTYFPQTDTYGVTAYDEDTGQESRLSSTDDATNDLSLKKNYNTITWNAVAGATLYRIYKSQTTGLFGYIGSTDALSFRDANLGPDTSQGPPVGDNPFDAAGDYPATITFHEQRMWLGNTINQPNALFASKSADFENMDFSRPVIESDAFSIGLVANRVNVVNQLVSTKQGLIALTSDNIFSVQGSNQDYIAASPPPRVRVEVSRGGSSLNPITIDNVTMYEAAKGGEIRTIGYEFELDGVRSDDLTIFSRQFFDGHDIVSWAFSEKPQSCIFLVRADGKLLCLTWDQAQEVWGWTICYTGELDDDGEATDLFKGVCVIYEEGEDRAYFVVQRTIEGESKLYIERMASRLWEDQEEACYLDSARTFINEDAVSEVDRLDHLEARQVVAYVDGNVVRTDGDGDPLMVNNGSINLPSPGLRITVGLPYTALIETLPLAVQTGQGWSVARAQQAGKVTMKVVNTRGIKAGPNEDNLFPVKLRHNEAWGAPTELFSGSKTVEMAGVSGDETTVVVKSDDPLPFQISAILVEPDVRER